MKGYDKMAGKLCGIAFAILIICALIPPLWIVEAVLLPVASVVVVIGIILGYLGL